jgi:FAD/FMN-containing dehydrogenase
VSVIEPKSMGGGRILWRNDNGYEQARRTAVSNGRNPDRFPDVIVRAQSNDDVIAAVQLAKERSLKIGIRSGGHSWAASFLRDGGMLLDLSQMKDFSVDVGTGTATIQPGLKGADLNRALLKDRLFFPSGHCRPVSLGGFLLQGGFGWNSRLWGPACCSILGMDIVTADGELVHASESQNADLFWAARGSGPGFFGVVTRFHLSLRPRPHTMMKSDYVYPIEVLEDVLRWIRTVQSSLPLNMEPLVFVRRDMFDHSGPTALVTAPVMADTQEEARAALALLETCPVLGQAAIRKVNIVTELDGLLQGAEDLLYPQGAHYAADNMWTNASADALLPGIRRIVETLPPAPSHMMWMLWGPTQPRPDMSFSMEADLYIALYGISHDAAGETTSQAWVTERMRELENFAEGIQLADENLGARPFRFLADSNFRRLQAIRSERDPNGMFHSYMGLPLQ